MPFAFKLARRASRFRGLSLLLIAAAFACNSEQSLTDPGNPPTNESTAIASVAVTPGSGTLAVGQTSQYAVIATDSSGKTVSAGKVTWSSSNESVITVNASGVVTARATGSATITATTGGQTGSASVTVGGAPPPPPAATGWPNEPGGLSQLVNQSFDGLATLGWSVVNNGRGLVSVTADAGAPMSASNVLQFRYPSGYTGGGAPGTALYGHGAAKEVYAGFWWKPSSPWQNHPSNVNKVAFWQTGTWGSSADLQMYGPGPYYLHVVTQFPGGTVRLPPNATATAVTLGVWHRVEWHMRYGSGGADGLVEWWLDGVLQGRYANVQTPGDGGFIEYQFSPTWGGLDGTKTEDDYFLFDHVKLSRR
ncbi:MAG: Ig-like domain-containing protein [Gemmatimonadetes bacterium]|nr:Ig-like domain-containing protein [Gemmatimonadota bacterium]